ncbi:hypothetical protein WN51_01561 [Melipona quadrifasciata]|uniref:Uncharacterized protein n=1 Tax=Melipona quadrifasciata TaxID=166423 RepID=A0A0N0BEV3_9HYME|nr:hypothetical protein WN51_01561 [Melipona quadrifasciata]
MIIEILLWGCLCIYTNEISKGKNLQNLWNNAGQNDYVNQKDRSKDVIMHKSYALLENDPLIVLSKIIDLYCIILPVAKIHKRRCVVIFNEYQSCSTTNVGIIPNNTSKYWLEHAKPVRLIILIIFPNKINLELQ